MNINNQGLFHISKNDPEDTYDVYFSDSYGKYLIAETPSKNTAAELARAFNQIKERFTEFEDDQSATAFGTKFDYFMERTK